MRTVTTDDGEVRYEFTLWDKVLDHLLITLPALIAPLWFVGAAAALSVGEWGSAMDLVLLGIVWVTVWWLVWFGPRP